MTLNLLPGPEGWHLCACEAERVERLSAFPLPGWMMWCWSDDRRHVLTVDQGGKRVTTYRLEGEAFVRTMSPSTLPKDVKAHCIAMKGEQPYIGEKSLWVPRGPREWEHIPMPEFAQGEGKRLDGILLDGDRLVAVDDILLPKYNLEYDVSDPATPVYVGSKRIRANISYERIYSVAGGTRWFVTLSRGINHGNQASYCTVFHLETLNQVWAYPFWSYFMGTKTEISLRHAVFLDDCMCMLVDHEEGPRLHWLDLTDEVLPAPRKPRPKAKRKPRSEMTPEELEEHRRARAEFRRKAHMFETPITGFARVHHLQACGSGQGVYLTGPDHDGQPQTRWQPIPPTPPEPTEV